MKYKIIEKSFFLRSMKVAAPVSTVVGFVGDFLQPLIEYASTALLASAALTIISGLFWFGVVRPKLKLRLELKDISPEQYEELANSNMMASAFSFFFIFCFVSGAVFGGQKIWAKDNQGIIASQVPELAILQKRILNIEEKLEEVKVEVAEVKKDVAEQRQDLAQVKDVVTDVSKVVGPVLEPKNKDDFLQNALFYYKSGNVEKGKISFVNLVQEPDVKFDEVMHVLSNIIAFHGVELAKTVHQDITAQNSENIPLKMATIKLYEQEDKKPKADFLRKLIEEEPNFTPAYVYLLRTYFANMPKAPEGYRTYLKEVDQLLARLEEKPLKEFYGLNHILHYDESILKIDLSEAQRMRTSWDFSKDFEFSFEIKYGFRLTVKFAPFIKISSLLYSFDDEVYIDPRPEGNYFSTLSVPEIPENATSIFIKYKTEDGVLYGPIEVKENFFEKMMIEANKKLNEISSPSSRQFDLYSYVPALYISKQVIIKTQNGERILEVPQDKNILSPELFHKKYTDFVREKIQIDKNDPVVGIQFVYRNGQKSALK